VRLQVKGKNVELSPALKEYAQKKLGKLDRHLNDSTRVELELAEERNPSIGQNQVAEATIWTKGPVLRARESSEDMKASIDLLVDKLERQAKRYREKRRPWTSRARETAPEVAVGDDARPRQIVKTKQFAVKPMSPEEAALQLELIGHDFFVFRSADTNDVSVLYRRRDGNYGLIEPQVS
jgi:putative sigma-54 modulation protein